MCDGSPGHHAMLACCHAQPCMSGSTGPAQPAVLDTGTPVPPSYAGPILTPLLNASHSLTTFPPVCSSPCPCTLLTVVRRLRCRTLPTPLYGTPWPCSHLLLLFHRRSCMQCCAAWKVVGGPQGVFCRHHPSPVQQHPPRLISAFPFSALWLQTVFRYPHLQLPLPCFPATAFVPPHLHLPQCCAACQVGGGPQGASPQAGPA